MCLDRVYHPKMATASCSGQFASNARRTGNLTYTRSTAEQAQAQEGAATYEDFG